MMTIAVFVKKKDFFFFFLSLESMITAHKKKKISTSILKIFLLTNKSYGLRSIKKNFQTAWLCFGKGVGAGQDKSW